MAPKMISMKHFLAPLALAFGILLAQTAGFALVPGPILLSDEQIQALQGKATNPDSSPNPMPPSPVRLIQPTTRARAACLTVASQRFCPGIPFEKAVKLHDLVPAEQRERVFLFNEGPLLKGVLTLLPVPMGLPPARLGAQPLLLGPEPSLLSELRTRLPGLPVRQTFAQTFAFPSGFTSEGLAVWYYAETHLGLVTQTSEQGEYVIGAFVAK